MVLLEPLQMDAGLATYETFDEAGYLAANEDVARGVAVGGFKNGRDHFDQFGHREMRRQRKVADLRDFRQKKLEHFRACIDESLPHIKIDGKYNFLTERMREELRISPTVNVSYADYDGEHLEFVQKKQGFADSRLRMRQADDLLPQCAKL